MKLAEARETITRTREPEQIDERFATLNDMRAAAGQVEQMCGKAYNKALSFKGEFDMMEEIPASFRRMYTRNMQVMDRLRNARQDAYQTTMELRRLRESSSDADPTTLDGAREVLNEVLVKDEVEAASALGDAIKLTGKALYLLDTALGRSAFNAPEAPRHDYTSGMGRDVMNVLKLIRDARYALIQMRDVVGESNADHVRQLSTVNDFLRLAEKALRARTAGVYWRALVKAKRELQRAMDMFDADDVRESVVEGLVRYSKRGPILVDMDDDPRGLGLAFIRIAKRRAEELRASRPSRRDTPGSMEIHRKYVEMNKRLAAFGHQLIVLGRKWDREYEKAYQKANPEPANPWA